MRATRQGERRGERGSVLVLALLVTLAIVGVGITAMWLARSSQRVSSNITRRQEALYAAETGVELAREVLAPALKVDWTRFIQGKTATGAPCPAKGHQPRTKVPGKTVGGCPVFTGKGRILCDAAGKPIEDRRVVSTGSASYGKARYLENVRFTVYVRNDDAEECLRGDVDTDKRVVIRAEGVGRDGISFVAVEAVVGEGAGTAGSGCYSQAGGCGGQGSSSRKKVSISVSP